MRRKPAKRQRTQSSTTGRAPDFDSNRTVDQVPAELLLEIISYFPTATNVEASHGVLPESSLERSDALRALSQTCRRWKEILYPILWETLEVTAIRGHSGNWYRGIADALERKSLGILKSPDIAPYIQNMRIVVTRCSALSVLPAFVQCLNALPNLQKLNILYAHNLMASMLKIAFDRCTFPSIRTLILPTHAHHVLRACPSATTVICNNGEGKQLIDAIQERCKNVEVLEGIAPDALMMKRLVKAAPNLRSVKLRIPCIEIFPQDAIQKLSACKKLAHISLSTHGLGINDVSTVPCIGRGKMVLRKSKAERMRSLTITNTPWMKDGSGNWSETYIF